LRLILDTSFLIALREGDSRAQEALKARKTEADELGISRLTEYELLLGANYLWKKHGDARESAWLEEAMDWLTVYEVDGEVVRSAAEVQAEALLTGEPLVEMGLLVALSAKSGSELLTMDDGQLKMRARLKAKGVEVATAESRTVDPASGVTS
jgi:predicted nucleic acid-binding protein